MRDKYQVTEEPCEFNGSRTVLQSSGSCEGIADFTRSCHDAIEKIYGICRPNKRKKWVVDADIQGCFDNIDHDYLMKSIGNFPTRKLIHQWLKAGVMDKGVFHETDSGTPQGGIVSPLLANIALHGMEQALGVKYDYRGQSIGKRIVVRYEKRFLRVLRSRRRCTQLCRSHKRMAGTKGT